MSYAHDFFINNDVTLVTLIERIKAEIQLINTNYLYGDNVSSQVHAKNAANLMNDLEYNMTEASPSSDITQIYENGQGNSTTLALVVANVVDEILREYGTAFGIGYDLTDMSNIDVIRLSNTNKSSFDRYGTTILNTSNIFGSNNENITLSTANGNLVNVYDYETAQVLADGVNRIFNDNLSPLSPVNETNKIDRLENSFKQLKHAIEVKTSPEKLMEIVHIFIHPTLQEVYDLIVESDSYLGLADILYSTFMHNGQKYNATLISYYNEIREFKYEPDTLTLSWTMPFDWNMTNIQDQDIFVHEEIKIPKSLEEFSSGATLNATVNGMPLVGRSLVVDPFNTENATVVHYLINKNQILELAKFVEPRIDIMSFSLSL
jgi:hypothetical protein